MASDQEHGNQDAARHQCCPKYCTHGFFSTVDAIIAIKPTMTVEMMDTGSPRMADHFFVKVVGDAAHVKGMMKVTR